MLSLVITTLSCLAIRRFKIPNWLSDMKTKTKLPSNRNTPHPSAIQVLVARIQNQGVSSPSVPEARKWTRPKILQEQ